jgi:hypothetical protein
MPQTARRTTNCGSIIRARRTSERSCISRSTSAHRTRCHRLCRKAAIKHGCSRCEPKVVSSIMERGRTYCWTSCRLDSSERHAWACRSGCDSNVTVTLPCDDTSERLIGDQIRAALLLTNSKAVWRSIQRGHQLVSDAGLIARSLMVTLATQQVAGDSKPAIQRIAYFWQANACHSPVNGRVFAQNVSLFCGFRVGKQISTTFPLTRSNVFFDPKPFQLRSLGLRCLMNNVTTSNF